MRKWIVPPTFVKNHFDQWVHDFSWAKQMQWDEIPDGDAVGMVVQLLDESPVWLEDQTKWMRDEYPVNQVWYKHPLHVERVIGVEMDGVSRASAYDVPRIQYVQGKLVEAGFRLPFGDKTFPIHGVGGGITSRCYFPVLDRKGSTR